MHDPNDLLPKFNKQQYHSDNVFLAALSQFECCHSQLVSCQSVGQTGSPHRSDHQKGLLKYWSQEILLGKWVSFQSLLVNDIYVVFHDISPIKRLNGSHYKGHENTFGPFSQLHLSLFISISALLQEFRVWIKISMLMMIRC